jgi:hypothetical protein
MNKEDFITIKKYKAYINNEEALKISRKTPISSRIWNINSANLVDIILDVEDYFKSISIMSRWKND